MTGASMIWTASAPIFLRWIFWGSIAVLAYTYFAYAGWLWLRGRWWSKGVCRSPYSPTVSVVVAIRNEEPVLERKLRNLLTLDYPADITQLIVVSDGSTDRTDAILREYAENPQINVLLNQFSRGKASALNDALELAQGEIVVFTDARQTIEPGALSSLLENFADPQVGCVSGELMLGDPETGESREGTGIYWRLEKRIRELESASGSVVGASGAFYAIRRNLLAPLPPETILDDVYLPIQVARQGFRVVFDSRARAWDVADRGTEREFARKVRTISGNYQLLQLAPWLLTRANPIRFEFVSHKLMRLAAPFALAGVLVASLVLREPVYRFAFALEAVFCGLSLMTFARLKVGPVRRMADAAFAFILLNTAAVVAFANFISGRKAAWSR
jgi:poly-beta-1,6-N-acetyl-D-glucosamine synthase